MKGLYKDIYHTHMLMSNFDKLDNKVSPFNYFDSAVSGLYASNSESLRLQRVKQVRAVEDSICDGHPCEHWHSLLDKTEAKVKDLKERLQHEV